MTALEDELLALEIQRAAAAPADTRELRNALWPRVHAEGWKHAAHSDKGGDGGLHDSDQTLLRAYLDGSERAFRLLVDRHGGVLESYARRWLLPAEALEATQDAMLTLLKRAEKLLGDPGQDFRGYLFRAARFEIINRLRKRLREEAKIDAFKHELAAPQHDPLDAVLTAERRARLRDALHEHCNPLEQSVVLMMLNGQSQVDIAKELQLTDQYVRVLKHRASTKLSAALTGDANHDP